MLIVAEVWKAGLGCGSRLLGLRDEVPFVNQAECLGIGNTELATNPLSREIWDFPVARYRRATTVRRVLPDGMVAALP